MFTSTSNLNPKTTTLNTTIIRKNLSYFVKFGLSPSIAQYIDNRLIFHDVHIDNLIIVSDIEQNLWILNYLKSYQLNPTLVIYQILNFFYDDFYR